MLSLSKAPEHLGKYSLRKRHTLLEEAVAHINAKNDRVNIAIINEDEFINHLKNKDIDSKFIASRYQLIIRYDNHYTAVDIDKRNNPPSCLILDAAGDSRYTFYSLNAFFLNYECAVVNGFSMDENKNIQRDKHSCSLFALDHCIQLSYTESDFHKFIFNNASKKTDDHFAKIPWDALPPNFLWNAQLPSFLKQYEISVKKTAPSLLDQKMPNGLSYNEYLACGLVSYPVNDALVIRNESINIHILKPLIESLNNTNTFKDRLIDLKNESSHMTDLSNDVTHNSEP